MLRVFFLLIVFTSIYLIFLFLGLFDSILKIELSGYLIELRLITFVLIFLVLQVFLLIFYKIILYVTNLTQINSVSNDKVAQLKLTSNDYVMNILCSVIITQDLDFQKKEVKQFFQNCLKKDLYNLFCDYLESKVSIEKEKIVLQKLLAYVDNLDVIKKLAVIHYNNNLKEESSILIKKFLNVKYDDELAFILSEIEYQDEDLQGLEEVVNKIDQNTYKRNTDNNQLLSNYYSYLGEQYFNQNSFKAEEFMIKSFNLNYINYKNLELLMQLCQRKGDQDNIDQFLYKSFEFKPEFILVKFYKKYRKNVSNEEIWTFFIKIISPEKEPYLFLTISNYLDLSEESQRIQNNILE